MGVTGISGSGAIYEPAAAAELEEVPVAGGLKGEWNEAVEKGLEGLKSVRLADEAEKGLRGLFAAKLREAGPDVPQEYVDQVAAQLASALRRAPITHGAIDRIAAGAEGYLADVGGYLAKKLTFTKLEARIRDDVKARGGLNPGEDQQIQKTVVAPSAREVAEAAARIKAKPYFDASLRVDVPALFRAPERFVKSIDASTGIKFERADFKANVGVRVDVFDPIAPDARVRVLGYAELEKGNFGARVEGEASVLSIYDGGKLAGTADLRANLRYTDPDLNLTARLDGTLRVPLTPEGKSSWEASAGLERKLNESVSLGLSANARGGDGERTSYGAMGTLKVIW